MSADRDAEPVPGAQEPASPSMSALLAAGAAARAVCTPPGPPAEQTDPRGDGTGDESTAEHTGDQLDAA